jgi:hypothetical protein
MDHARPSRRQNHVPARPGAVVRPAPERTRRAAPAPAAAPETGLPPWLSGLAPAGNQAIGALIVARLQRQPTTTDEAPAADAAEDAAPAEGPLLDDAQVTKARQFYTSQPGLYTPAIIEQLRTALGLDSAGGIDDEMVLGVAKFQATEGAQDSPALKVDGMAGPRTLPRIFRSGLHEVGQGKAFGEKAQGQVIDQWAALATPEARLKKLVELVNATLDAHGVPKVTEAFDADKNNDGSFNFPTWAMNVGRDQLDKASVNADEARELTATIYHEARHTEQWFRMAQLRAAQGLSAAGIATEMGIPARIAREAKSKPLTRGSMEAVIAQGWFDSVYGSGAEHREAVLNELTAAGNALRAAQAARDKNPTPATEAALVKAQERNTKALEGHSNLAEENDAFATEAEASSAITGGSPAPTPSPAGGVLPETDLP